MKTLVTTICILALSLINSGCRKPIEGESDLPVPKDVLSKGAEKGAGGPDAPGAEPAKGGPGGPGGVPSAPINSQGR